MDRNRTPRRRPEAPSAPTTTITELARRYHSCAVALATSLGLPMTEAFLRDHRESVSSIFIAADRAGVRLPPAVQLPPLLAPAAASIPGATGHSSARPPAVDAAPNNGAPAPEPPTDPEMGAIECTGMPPAPEAPPTNGHGATVTALAPETTHTMAPALGAMAPSPPGVITTMAELPTHIPAGLQLPCAEALIADLRPAQLALLCGKVGLRALANTTLEPLHVALLAERARRLAQGRTHAQPTGEG